MFDGWSDQLTARVINEWGWISILFLIWDRGILIIKLKIIKLPDFAMIDIIFVFRIGSGALW